MHEIAKVTLENDLDLILAHKRTMKLAELAGLSLSAQTTFATAISEVSRNIIENGKSGCLVLCVDNDMPEKYIVACLKDKQLTSERSRSGLEYAKRLVDKYNISTKGTEISIELYYYISPSFRIDIMKLDEWRSVFRNEPPISPYDELKRKNEQLQELSEKVKKSEEEHKTLTNALPLIIFSLDPGGQLVFANEWLSSFTGHTPASLNSSAWKTVVHEDDYEAFDALLKNVIIEGNAAIKTQARLKNKSSNDYLWHQVSVSPPAKENNELQHRIGYIVDIHAQKIFEETLRDNIELKETQEQLKDHQHAMEDMIGELNRSNEELQQFAFIASHDLQEPVRKLLFYSDFLLKKYDRLIDQKGKDFLANMHASAHRMRILIHDLLAFSQINKEELVFSQVDLNRVADSARQDLELMITSKKASVTIQPLPVIHGDERMLCQLFSNLIGNSLKYSKQDIPPEINISNRTAGGTIEITFSDNGIGFDDKYSAQMFTLFQRLHSREKYEGTGLGLAICRKITDLHKGTIRAKASEGKGAAFVVTLPKQNLS